MEKYLKYKTKYVESITTKLDAKVWSCTDDFNSKTYLEIYYCENNTQQPIFKKIIIDGETPYFLLHSLNLFIVLKNGKPIKLTNDSSIFDIESSIRPIDLSFSEHYMILKELFPEIVTQVESRIDREKKRKK